MRRPVHEVLEWPLWVVRAYAEFFMREPPAEERCEALLAEQAAMFASVNRSPGAPATRASDFRPFLSAWDMPAEADGYSEVDREIMRQLRGKA